MWQIKGDVLPCIYSSLLKKCKLRVTIINQLVLLFSRKRPVTCYIITQSHLVSKINSSFSSCFMIIEFLFLKANFSYWKRRKYCKLWGEKEKKRKKKVSHHLSSQWGEQEHFLFPLLSHFSPSSCCCFPINFSRLSFWGCAKIWAGET